MIVESRVSNPETPARGTDVRSRTAIVSAECGVTLRFVRGSQSAAPNRRARWSFGRALVGKPSPAARGDWELPAPRALEEVALQEGHLDLDGVLVSFDEWRVMTTEEVRDLSSRRALRGLHRRAGRGRAVVIADHHQ